jgi:hypothetical protein
LAKVRGIPLKSCGETWLAAGVVGYVHGLRVSDMKTMKCRESCGELRIILRK